MMTLRVKLFSWWVSASLAGIVILVAFLLKIEIEDLTKLFLMIMVCLYPLVLSKTYQGSLDWMLKKEMYPSNMERSRFKYVMTEEKRMANYLSLIVFILLVMVIPYMSTGGIVTLILLSFTSIVLSS